MTVKTVHRGLLVTAAVGGLMLASQPLASAAILPESTSAPATLVSTQAPAVPGVPSGGAVDSLKGIVFGAAAGATPVLGLPTFPTLP
jgi:hypothetical protein